MTLRQSSSDSLKVEASATSAAVEVKGESASRITQAILDIVSPFTNVIGWAGDQLTIARKTSTLRALAKAVDQLNKEGILKGNVPPKLLLPWVDGASLETDDADSLTEAWAGLFVRAVKSSDAAVISYIETLKKLGKREASLLQFYATDTSPTYSQKFYDPQSTQIFSEKNPLRVRAIERLERLLEINNKSDELAAFMDSWGIQGMCQIIYFSTSHQQMVSTKFFRENEHSISNLEHLGLITISRKLIQTKLGNVRITWFQITKYAFDMMWACEGRLTGSGELRTEARKKVGEDKNA